MDKTLIFLSFLVVAVHGTIDDLLRLPLKMIPHHLLSPPLLMAGSQPLRVPPIGRPAPPHLPRLAPFSLPAAPLLGNRLSYAPVHSPYSFNYGYNILPYRNYVPNSYGNYGNSYVKVSNTMNSAGSSNYASYKPNGFSSHYHYQVTNSAPKKPAYGSNKDSYVKVASGVKINPPHSVLGQSAAHPSDNYISSGTNYNTNYNTPSSFHGYQYEVHNNNNQYANSGYNKGGGSSAYVKVSSGYKIQTPPSVNGYSYSVQGPLNYGKGHSSGYVHSSSTVPGYTVYSPGNSYEYSVHNRPSNYGGHSNNYGGSSTTHVKVVNNAGDYGGNAHSSYEYTVNNHGDNDGYVLFEPVQDNQQNSYNQPTTNNYQQNSYNQPTTNNYQQNSYNQPTTDNYQQNSYNQPTTDSYQQNSHNQQSQASADVYNQQDYSDSSSSGYSNNYDDSSSYVHLDSSGGDEYYQPSVHSYEYSVENYPNSYSDGDFGARLKSYVRVKDKRIINGHSYGQH